MDALIGYTGLVGTNILLNKQFTDLYNSKNIKDIKGKEYDLLICSGASGTKWMVNKEPQKDLDNINYLISCLKQTQVKKLVLISTVDVYSNPFDINEDTIIEKIQTPYGENRKHLEEFVQNNFENYSIIRLPGLYGKGLQKNFIFDLINNHCLDWTHKDSVFQWYDLFNVWKDIKFAIDNNIKIFNITTEPMTAAEIAKECFNLEFNNITLDRDPANYNVKTKYALLYNNRKDYLYLKQEIIEGIKQFAEQFKNKGEIL